MLGTALIFIFVGIMVVLAVYHGVKHNEEPRPEARPLCDDVRLPPLPERVRRLEKEVEDIKLHSYRFDNGNC